ncbi:HAMP domain-containing histidine kinase [Vallitalea pronyensis]|uniref:histidine kinase n=1 Tax=Vallitalea pronyensis TaxID=1348613 RepID=A0A8J8SG44_9FIRM|nr:HAMP domain-containing sensor histidine kinase [Vallitalea pronyensis]QUI22002.1 HAMP domain-containing histidine kinase [Vallitalea pronyensis]
MKLNITKKVILLYIPLIIGALLVSSIISNIVTRIYMQKEVMEDLKNEAVIVRNFLFSELGDERQINQQVYQEAVARTRRLNRIGLESQLEIIKKLPNNTLQSVAKESQLDEQMLKQIVNRLQKGKDKIILDSYEDNYKYYIAAMPINRIIENNRKVKHWVIIYTSTKEVSAFTNNIFRLNMLIMIIVGLIATIMAILFAKSITKPIIKLKNRAHRISKRDFDAIEPIHTKDEIQELSQSLEDMAEELKQYDLAQKRFLQNASHELKTPLTSIGGYAEGLKDGVFENKEEALDIIMDESLRLKKLVEQIIFLSKVETTHEFFKITTCDLGHLLNNAVKKVKGSALKDSVSIEFQVNETIHIQADEDKLLQAFINILSNCIRHAKAHIHVDLVRRGNTCQIIIDDDGEGFSDEDLAHLFERFYKGSNGSTGLGMTITQSIIHKLGGDIQVANNQKGGARFIVTLHVESSM